MPDFRLLKAVGAPEIQKVNPPFSFFDMLDQLSDSGVRHALHRCFSFARMKDVDTIIIEDLNPVSLEDGGILFEENQYLKEIFPEFRCQSLKRVSFWRKSAEAQNFSLSSDHLIGCLILKKDSFSLKTSITYIFDAVFRSPVEEDSYCHRAPEFKLRIMNDVFSIKGFLFAQQNQITKSCAQVALYSALTTYGVKNVSFVQMNKILKISNDKIKEHLQNRENNIDSISPVALTVDQIDEILKAYSVNFFYEDYCKCEQGLKTRNSGRKNDIRNAMALQSSEKGTSSSKLETVICAIVEFFRKFWNRGGRYNTKNAIDAHEEYRRIFIKQHPFHRRLYLSVESGYGALISIRTGGQDAHLLPVFGHRFDPNAWIPHAENGYFHYSLGENTKAIYIPSSSWTNAFLLHDDNLGVHFHLPSLWESRQVTRIWELADKHVKYSGSVAEILACNVLNDFANGYRKQAFEVQNEAQKWFDYICGNNKNIINLRTIFLTRDQYLEHLRNMRDWNGIAFSKKELKENCFLAAPNYLWIVEISTTQLFSANKRKVGEILFNAESSELNLPEDTTDIPQDNDSSLYRNILYGIRFPGAFFLFKQGGNSDKQEIMQIPLSISSHVENWTE